MPVPDPVRYGGYVYVVKFAGDIVKVGRTSTPANRLENHRRSGRALGHDVVDFWFSPHHGNVSDNEKLLIDRVTELGGQPITTEFFTGAEFRSVVDAASSLTFEPAVPHEHPVRERMNWTSVATIALKEPVDNWVMRERRTGHMSRRGHVVPGQSWKDIAGKLERETSGQVKITGETLRLRYGAAESQATS